MLSGRLLLPVRPISLRTPGRSRDGLKEAGLTGVEVGAVMGVSEQRASQLLRDAG